MPKPNSNGNRPTSLADSVLLQQLANRLLDRLIDQFTRSFTLSFTIRDLTFGLSYGRHLGFHLSVQYKAPQACQSPVPEPSKDQSQGTETRV